jgi:hypothetical protein
MIDRCLTEKAVLSGKRKLLRQYQGSAPTFIHVALQSLGEIRIFSTYKIYKFLGRLDHVNLVYGLLMTKVY